MTHKSANSNAVNEPARCQHRTSTGRRCRLRVVDAHSGLCFRHAQLQLQHFEIPDLSPELVGNLLDFTSAAHINQVLSKLLILLSQNRISPRRAAVIAYVTSLLLRTLPAIEHESGEDDEEVRVIWDMPRPSRDVLAETGLPRSDRGEPLPQTP